MPVIPSAVEIHGARWFCAGELRPREVAEIKGLDCVRPGPRVLQRFASRRPRPGNASLYRQRPRTGFCPPRRPPLFSYFLSIRSSYTEHSAQNSHPRLAELASSTVPGMQLSATLALMHRQRIRYRQACRPLRPCPPNSRSVSSPITCGASSCRFIGWSATSTTPRTLLRKLLLKPCSARIS